MTSRVKVLAKRGAVRRSMAVLGILAGVWAATAWAHNAPAFKAPAFYPATGGSLFPVATGDLNRDGRPDIVVGSEDNDTVSVLYGKRHGFKAPTDLSAPVYPFDVAIADLNGDHRPDIVVAGYNSDSVDVILAKRHGGFHPYVSHLVGSTPYAVVVADLNHDGKLDLVTPNYGDDNVSVLLGDGHGGFGAQHTYSAGTTTPVAVVARDFNSDGKVDLAVLDQNSPMGAKVALLPGNGHGAFGSADFFDLKDEVDPYGMAVGQFTQDHRADLVVTTCRSGPGAVLLLPGKKVGFKATRSYPDTNGTCAYEPAVGDLNGDGRPDLVTTLDSSHDSGAASVLYGRAKGGLAASHKYKAAEGASAYSAAIADFNGDKRPDVAVPDYENPRVAVLNGK